MIVEFKIFPVPFLLSQRKEVRIMLEYQDYAQRTKVKVSLRLLQSYPEITSAEKGVRSEAENLPFDIDSNVHCNAEPGLEENIKAAMAQPESCKNRPKDQFYASVFPYQIPHIQKIYV